MAEEQEVPSEVSKSLTPGKSILGKSWEALRGFLSIGASLCYVAFFIWLQFAGIIHAYKMHSTGTLLLTVFLPPVSWYYSFESLVHKDKTLFSAVSKNDRKYPEGLVGHWDAFAITSKGSTVELKSAIRVLQSQNALNDTEAQRLASLLTLSTTKYDFESNGDSKIFSGGHVEDSEWYESDGLIYLKFGKNSRQGGKYRLLDGYLEISTDEDDGWLRLIRRYSMY